MNICNDSWLAKDPNNVPIVGKIKLSISIYISRIVSDNNDTVPSYFFKNVENVTKEVYLNILQYIMIP